MSAVCEICEKLRFACAAASGEIATYEVEVNLRPTVSRPVRLGIGPPYGTLDQILSCSSFFQLTIT
jgi:hypothetical protein